MSLHPATALTQEAWDFGERDHWPLKRTPGAAEISADLERWFGLLGTSIVIKAGKATLTGTLQIDIDSTSPRASLSGRELEGGLAPSSRVTASPASTRDPTPDPLGGSALDALLLLLSHREREQHYPYDRYSGSSNG